MCDLGSNFYCNEEHVKSGTHRANASHEQLQELNPYVKVNVIDELSIEDHKNYSLVCYTENFKNIDHLNEVNQFCRDNRVGFLLSETLGAVGYVFSDFGDQHVITDHNGEQCKSFIVTSITQEDGALVTVHEDKRHTFEEGDYVKFVEVEGMSEVNDAQPFEIT